jgi:hypothetical protein
VTWATISRWIRFTAASPAVATSRFTTPRRARLRTRRCLATVGALGPQCQVTATEPVTWGKVKSMYR